MKITILSEIDYAASGYKLCEAIRKNTKYDIEIYSGKYSNNKFGHPYNTTNILRHIQQRINGSDIIHLKGDWPPQNNYMGLTIMHKPIIISVSGSHFRKKEHGGHGKYTIDQYDSAKIKTAFTPDLLYKGFSDVWTPHPINSHVEPIEWQRRDPPVLMHTPSRRDVKGTAFIESVFRKLTKRIKVKTVILENVPFKQAVEERKRATIFFDQFKVGFYGNSAIEAMQYGIPVAAWISPRAIKQANGSLDDCPVITEERDVDKWVKKIEEILNSDMSYLSCQTKAWCDYIHSYQSVARMWKYIYNAI